MKSKMTVSWARWSVIILWAIVAVGCTSYLDHDKYLAYLNDPEHGLTQTQQVNGVSITCGYRPIDLLVSQELANQAADPLPLNPDSVRQTFRDKQYLTLSLSRDGAEVENLLIRNELAFGQAISYLSNGIAQDVFLHGLGQPDSVAAIAATYPRQYGNTGRSTVLLVFAAPQLDATRGFTVTYRDTHFNLGQTRFVFLPQDVQRLPRLDM